MDVSGEGGGIPEFSVTIGDEMFNGGTFQLGDRYLLFQFSAKDEWERHRGVPFPSRLEVLDVALPGGWMEATGTHILPEGGVESTGVSESDYSSIQYTFEMLNGVPECIEVLILPRPNGQRGVRQRDFEYVRIDDVLEAALAHLAIWRPGPLPSQHRKAAVNALMRSRRQTITDDLLRQVADVYEENLHSAPTQAVADHFGISKSAADKRVKRARDAGFISKTFKTGRRPQERVAGRPRTDGND